MGKEVKYSLVGAYWDGTTDMSDVFVAGGFWTMGYDDEERPDYAKLRDEMKPGDRIAIKALGGRGKSHILIKAIGVIRAIDPYEKRVYVDWKLSGLSRKVHAKGKFSTIHPPLNDPGDASWIQEIFTL